MGGQNVKNTIVERILQIVAPHLCCGCGKEGALVCDNCKYDISFDPFFGCVLCGTSQRCGVCEDHGAPFTSAYVVSNREGVVRSLIDTFKFHNAKGASKPLAELLDGRIPSYLPITAIVPVPTAPAHIRERGYDQVELLARQLSSLRKAPVKRLLARRGNSTQHVAGRVTRARQARSAFTLRHGMLVKPGALYLLIDDIVTTGATITEAARIIRRAGGTVMIGALAYQPLSPRS